MVNFIDAGTECLGPLLNGVSDCSDQHLLPNWGQRDTQIIETSKDKDGDTKKRKMEKYSSK